jgi:hypothetical protein
VDELYVFIRRVLLDAIDALGWASSRHGRRRCTRRLPADGEASLAVAPTTRDAIDHRADGHRIDPSTRASTQGSWLRSQAADSVGVSITHRPTSASPRTEVTVDLLVPGSVSPGRGRRATDLAGHDRRAARIVRGLEGAIVDAGALLSFNESSQRHCYWTDRR